MHNSILSEISNYRCFDYRYNVDLNEFECGNNFYNVSDKCERNQSTMCVQDSTMRANISETFSSVVSKCATGSTVRSVLRRAMLESRLTIGLMPAIQRLSQSGGALFCVTAKSVPGDSLNHMQEVLLEAFCTENGIFVIKVDSVDKLRDLIGCYHHTASDFSCILVHQPFDEDSSDEEVEKSLSQAEKSLVQHCHTTWGMLPQPVVKLPEK